MRSCQVVPPLSPTHPACPGCSTDALILLKVLVHHGIPREQAEAQLPRLQAAMIEHFTKNASQVGAPAQP